MDILGGPEPHGRRSGVVHITTETDEAAFDEARTLVCLLGQQGSLGVDAIEDTDLGGLMPDSSRRAYDVHPLIENFVDEGTFTELHAKWAPNIVVGLGRLGGRTVGIVANNPLRLRGWLDSASAEKAARFVRMCDAFAVALVVLVDVAGYLPGLVRSGGRGAPRAKLLHAFAECVFRASRRHRKSYGVLRCDDSAPGATSVRCRCELRDGASRYRICIAALASPRVREQSSSTRASMSHLCASGARRDGV
jgi:Acetyl-CoA carboxylase, carboxyltransferase component (subunits alpha and beta)